jgi:hypothetical protein
MLPILLSSLLSHFHLILTPYIQALAAAPVLTPAVSGVAAAHAKTQGRSERLKALGCGLQWLLALRLSQGSGGPKDF